MNQLSLGGVTDKPYHMRCELNANRFVWYKVRLELTSYYDRIQPSVQVRLNQLPIPLGHQESTLWSYKNSFD